MPNRYPLWKHLLIAAVLVAGVVFALPNVFGEDPAVQISGERGVGINSALAARVAGALEAGGAPARAVSLEGGRLLARFGDTETQLRAQDLLRADLGPGYVVALNLAPATPAWLSAAGLLPMYLGLDLRGGVHFLMEVDMPAAVSQAVERYAGDVRTLLREERLRYRSVAREPDGGIVVRLRTAEAREEAERRIGREFPDLAITEQDLGDDFRLHLALREEAARATREFALQQNVTTLRNRVNELGVAEPVIQRQGDRRIVVQLPGVQDTARAKDILGATATLEFRMVDEEHSVSDAVAGRVPAGSRLYFERNGRPVLLHRQLMLTGDSIIDAASGIDQQSGSPAVFITLDGKGARIFSERTKDKIGRSMAVVFIENKTEIRRVDGEDLRTRRTIEEVINIAVIRDRLGKRFQITGLDSTAEARDLALLLRAGALAAPIEIIEERTVGPSLGQDNIDQGLRSVILGFILVLAFMAFWYRGFGFIANLALAANLVLIVAVLSMLQATLTLPGIAGIVLTVGMAVDANVLIFERIREEIRNGNTPQASIHSGYQKAFSTILDANVTTLIAAVVLFGFGTGPIKGFAITLSIGIVTSMFTAIMGTRAVVGLAWAAGGSRRSPSEDVPMRDLFSRLPQIDFLGRRRAALYLSAGLLAVSILSLAVRGLDFGIDFTGGTLIEVGYPEPVELDPIRDALAGAGFDEAAVQHFGTVRDVLVRLAPREELSRAELSSQVLRVLQEDAPVDLRRVEFVGPQVGEELTEDGGLAMLIALFGILVYVWLRFEYRFALGAIAALVHDVLITLGFFSVLGLEFDLSVLAAVLAVIGYSLNDTIVVFDRVRENFRRVRRGSTEEVMNRSLNQTLSRTLMTSLTTLLVLLALFIFGGELIRGFATALMVGVVIGTYSSIYVASVSALALGVSRMDLLPVKKEGADDPAGP